MDRRERKARAIRRLLPRFGLYSHDVEAQEGAIAVRVSRLFEADPEGVLIFSVKMKIEAHEIQRRAEEMIAALRKWDIYATAEVQIR